MLYFAEQLKKDQNGVFPYFDIFLSEKLRIKLSDKNWTCSIAYCDSLYTMNLGLLSLGFVIFEVKHGSMAVLTLLFTADEAYLLDFASLYFLFLLQYP